jgi:ferredoxin-NADP reductase
VALLNPARRRRGTTFAPLRVLEALATPHGMDRYLELVHPMLAVRELRAVVTDVDRPTADSVVLTLRPNRRWRGFRAGQFVQVTLEIDGVLRSRCFSPCSSQHRRDGRFELTVKASADGLVSRHLFDAARPGLVVGLTPAAGTFVLPEPRPARVLLVSGGSGITPVLSMLRTLLDEGYRGDVRFLHYNRTPADVAHLAELRTVAADHPNLTVTLACTRSADGDVEGRFTPAHLEGWTDAETYVCGPAPLMKAVRDHCASEGAAARLHTEEFTAPAPMTPDADATGTITFGTTTVDNAGTTLLEQAEAAGLNPEHGCRMGICFTCTKVKTSGCTRNVRTGELSTEPDQEIQLCISVPVGDVAVAL